MLIPKFWENANYGGKDKNGKHVAFSVWGWSCESAADAKELATERAKRAFDWWVNGGQRREAYDYLDQPLREEIIETIGSDGDQTAVITRNRYGALVLNCASVCFVDVDFPEVQSSGFLDALKMMFSKRLREDRRDALRIATMENCKELGGEQFKTCVSTVSDGGGISPAVYGYACMSRHRMRCVGCWKS